MTTRTRTQTLAAAVALLVGTCLAAAQQPAAQQPAGTPAPASTAPPTQKIPVDPQITTGRFQNGLRYYIRANKRPENRAELRLAVKAGSILEDDDQLGLAHLTEHMAFNGTKNFPKQDIVAFMQSAGMRLGPHVNAYTSFDETVYMLHVPTDKPELMKKAFQILEDWAHTVTFDPVEIDKERGVVIEEWRGGRGAAARMRDQQFPLLFKDSRYAERLPIGKKETLESFKHERLKKFYADWYRPDLMALVAVGDFDAAAIEGLVKQHFAPLAAPAVPRLRPGYKVPDHAGTLVSVVTDKEATMSDVTVFNKLPRRDQTTVGAYRQKMVERLASGMLNARLAELTQKADPPFVFANAGRGLFVGAMDVASLAAVVKEGAHERGLTTLLTETERVSRFGFTATELERQKRAVLRNYELLLVEKNTRDSSILAAEYLRNFTQEETIPGIAYEFALHQRFLPEITLIEVNGVAKDWLGAGNRVVLATGPDKPGVATPDEAKLAATMKAAAATKDLTAYVDTTGTAPLLESIPAPGKIAKTATKDAYGITEWDLANGVKVVLKPTTFKEDEVVFRAISWGGHSLASDADYIAASTASALVGAGGVGKYSQVELGKMLSGKVASVFPTISELDEGLSGGGSRKDLETLFQLIYLRFTQPRADAAVFEAMKAQRKAMLANQKASPEFAFMEMMQGALSQNHVRRRPMTPELVDQMNLERSLAFYKDRFADASDFTFVFVGSFDLDTMKPLVERYLGALPSSGRRETWKDVGVAPPAGIVEKSVSKGIEPKSRASVVFTGPFVYDQTQRVAIRALGLVMQTRLRDILREELGGTYSVGVSPSYSKFPVSRYTLSIDFGCSPDRTEALVKTVFEDIETLKAAGPTDKQVSDVREQLIREFETSSKQNAYLVAQIYLRYQYNDDVGGLFAMAENYKKLTAESIRDAARAYLNTKNYVKGTLFPESKTSTAGQTVALGVAR